MSRKTPDKWYCQGMIPVYTLKDERKTICVNFHKEYTMIMLSHIVPRMLAGRWFYTVLAVLVLMLAASPVAAQGPEQNAWYSVDENGTVTIDLYFFWSETCPHCREAHPFIEDLPERHSWLRLHSLELSQNPDNVQQYMQMASALGQEGGPVPAFFYCGTMSIGYDSAETTGQALENILVECHAYVEDAVGASANAEPAGTATAESVPPEPAPAPQTGVERAAITLPIVGTVSAETVSLPALTVTIAALDAFNPCAFFVLLFLLSLMVHARSRPRMALIGGIFVFFSGLIYFVFMAAWLNVFLLIGELQIITIVAGVIAVVVAAINIKDYFWYKRGVSLSIPERAKPGLYQRARNLLQATSLPSLVAGTVVLAIAANTYELLCTSGFPMVFTRILTLERLPVSTFYAYLLLYNVVYVIPLSLIVLAFVIKFGARRLTEEEGRILKLVSGLMMLFLGGVLLIAPAALSNIATAVGLLLLTLIVAGIIIALDRHRHKPLHRSTAG